MICWLVGSQLSSGLSAPLRFVESRGDGVVYNYRFLEHGKIADIFAVRGGCLGEKQAAMTVHITHYNTIIATTTVLLHESMVQLFWSLTN